MENRLKPNNICDTDSTDQQTDRQQIWFSGTLYDTLYSTYNFPVHFPPQNPRHPGWRQTGLHNKHHHNSHVSSRCDTIRVPGTMVVHRAEVVVLLCTTHVIPSLLYLNRWYSNLLRTSAFSNAIVHDLVQPFFGDEETKGNIKFIIHTLNLSRKLIILRRG